MIHIFLTNGGIYLKLIDQLNTLMQIINTCLSKLNEENRFSIFECPYFVELLLNIKVHILKKLKTNQLIRCIYLYLSVNI